MFYFHQSGGTIDLKFSRLWIFGNYYNGVVITLELFLVRFFWTLSGLSGSAIGKFEVSHVFDFLVPRLEKLRYPTYPTFWFRDWKN